MKIANMKVELLRVDGTDLDVCQAARVSFDKTSDWGPEVEFIGGVVVRKLTDRDAGLIRYLAKHDHWTPMAHVGAQFRVKAPIFVARQLVKHCLVGSTEVSFTKVVKGRSNGVKRRTLVDLYTMWSGQTKFQGGEKGRRNVRGGRVKTLDVTEMRFSTSHIVDVLHQGKRPVVRLVTESGQSLRLTADHEVFTQRGWVPAGGLIVGEDQLVSESGGETSASRRLSRDCDVSDVVSRRQHLKVNCAHCGSNTDLECDHIVPVNEGGTHEGGNLQTLCKTCHKVKSASEKAKGKSAFPPRYTKLVSRSDDGVEDVYDITVEGHHNFLANGLVVHNCVGLVWNEVSRRYVDSEPEFFLPDVWRARAENVKQGSADEPAPHQGALQGLARLHLERSLDLYSQMLENGVAPEQARMVLPLNVMTEWVWTGSLVAWARVCRLRLDPHAQVEVQEVAKHFDNLLRPAFPVSWPALMGESQ